MELLMATMVAILFAGGTYLLLRPNFIRVVMGLGLFSNAVNLLLIVVGGYTQISDAPFVPTKGTPDVSQMMDPLPPDIILTAIVISFAVGSLLLIVGYRVYLDHGTDNPDQLPNLDEDDEAEHGSRVPDVLEELSHACADSPHERGDAELHARHAHC